MLVGVAAILAANNALSAESYVLRHKYDGGSWDFDMGSIVIVNDTIRKSQMTLNLTKPLQDQPTGTRYDRVVFMYEHDCKANRMRVMDNISYLAGVRVTISRAGSEWQPAGDSVAHKYACALIDKQG
jgi:hypothetical protein